MPNFKCRACGHDYSDSHNIASCPLCGGLGKPNPKCTCTHWRSSFGVKLNLIHEKDPQCSVHSGKSAISSGIVDCFGYYFCPKCGHHEYCGKIKEGGAQKIKCSKCKLVFRAKQY